MPAHRTGVAVRRPEGAAVGGALSKVHVVPYCRCWWWGSGRRRASSARRARRLSSLWSSSIPSRSCRSPRSAPQTAPHCHALCHALPCMMVVDTQFAPCRCASTPHDDAAERTAASQRPHFSPALVALPFRAPVGSALRCTPRSAVHLRPSAPSAASRSSASRSPTAPDV